MTLTTQYRIAPPRNADVSPVIIYPMECRRYVGHQFLIIVTLLLSFLPLALPAQKPEEKLAPAVELTPRNGLPNVLAKLNTGGEVRIGYLGGSITAAPGWRVKTLAWFQSQYPKAQVSEINAAIGGTGSGLGVFRVGEHVLKHQPDLLFVEFAVNDAGTDPATIHRSMEGIVRQTWQANPNTDICFVYTFSAPMLEDLKNGKFSRSATAMEDIANHYHIPSIHMGLEVAQLEKDGKLVYQSTDKNADTAAGKIVFSTDGVHPLVETGHELYAAAVIRSLEKIKPIGKPAPHELIAPLRADNSEKARLIPIQKSMLKGNWTLLDPTQDNPGKRHAARVPSLWKANDPTACLEITVNGSILDMYDLVGPDGGQLNITVDGELKKPVNRIDAHCTYDRLSSFRVLTAPEGGLHKIKIQLSASAPDKKNILFERNRPDLEANPAKYANNHWYLGGLLLIGEVLP
ncbi:SGNH/GDSL hydrolase family protein [Phragmitibacter flavus]|nr:SGNH/GDSL hydrolase family protein [Phragmitibacter flavus]